jgi:hypothetical protein
MVSEAILRTPELSKETPMNRSLRTLLLMPLALALLLPACGEGKPDRQPREARHHHKDHGRDRTEDPEVRASERPAAPTADAPAAVDQGHARHHDDQSGGIARDGATPTDQPKRTHDHTLQPDQIQWLLTMHGEEGKPQGVWALTGDGELKGPVNAAVPSRGDGGPAPHSLRGLTPLPDGGFLAMNAFSKDTRILRFGPKAADGTWPYAGDFTALGPSNPAMVHAYQMAIGPDGSVYVGNQDTNTVTRYAGVGQPDAGEPRSPAASPDRPADLDPGVVVPSAKSSPEGIDQVRGITFGPDGLLYVCDRGAARVAAFDPATGRRVRVVADATDGLKHPIQALFSADGQRLYVGDNGHDCVFEVDMSSRKVRTLVPHRAGGLQAPSALAIHGPWLYVGSREGRQILRFSLKDGKPDDKPFATLPDNPEFLMWLGA